MLCDQPQHSELRYTFGGAAPVRHVLAGTRIISWTEDRLDGAVTQPGMVPSKVMAPGHDNSQTGPFFVDGAEPGDTLAIRIEKLEPTAPAGLSAFFPGFGALTRTDRKATLGAELPVTVCFFDVDRARGVDTSRPLAGNGARRRRWSRSSAASASPLPAAKSTHPPIESADALMSVGVSRPLEGAAPMAYKDMVRWVQEQTGMNEMDAYLFGFHNAQVTVAQIVDPQHAVLAKLPQDRLPPAS